MTTPNAPAVQQDLRYTLGVLFLINFLNFFDRAIPAVVLEPIRQEFSLDDTMLGLLGTGFTLIYALAGLPLGRLADRMRRTWILGTGVLVWSLMTAATAAAWNFASLFLIRLGVGIGEASCAPAANSMIGDMYPSEKRARALGFFMMGLPIANVACFALVGYLAQKYGWRTPFVLAAIPGILVAIMAFRLREPVRGSQESYRVDVNEVVDRPFRRVISIPTLWWIILSGAAVNFAAYSLATFLPSLLIRYHQASMTQAGLISALVLGLMGILGLGFGGWLADRMHQRNPKNGRLRLGAWCLLLGAPLLYIGLVQPAGSLVAATVWLALGWSMYFIYYVTVYPSVQDVVEPRLRATAMSVYFFFQYVLGAGFGTTITGMVSDYYARAAMAQSGGGMTEHFRAVGLQSSMSIVVPLSILITGIALWLASRRFATDVAKVHAAAGS